MNENEEIEIMDDDEVFLTSEVEETEFERQRIYENDYTLKTEKPLKNNKIKYAISVLIWLLFVVFTIIVMYIVIREPDAINKIIQKIF